jgi:hypothetical protein
MSDVAAQQAAAVKVEKEKEGYSAIALVLLLIVVSIFMVMFGLQTTLAFSAKRWLTREPTLAQVPQTLNVPALDKPTGTHIEFFNYECMAPWKGPAKTDQQNDWVDFTFPDGAKLRAYSPESQANSLEVFKGTDQAQQERATRLFGKHPFDSNYDLYVAVYNTTPSQLTSFMSRQESERVNTLLLWKANFDMQLPGGTFRFEANDLRGLQFGDPAASHAVFLRAFNNRDRQFEIMVAMAQNASEKLNQGDVNQIIATLKPIPLPGQ